MFTVYSITPATEQGKKDFWNPVGVGFENQDGSINLKLHMFPDLKLQGVIWSPSRPSAVINGKSVFVGEKVERAVVTAIEQESAKVTWNGEERVLTLR